MTIYIGTSGYSYPKWKGKFYPKALPAKQMLRYYGEHFPTVEINSTFNAFPKVSVLEAWMSDVPATFRFVLKAPKQITHNHRLKNSEELAARFHEVAETLGQHRGPLLYQLPPNLRRIPDWRFSRCCRPGARRRSSSTCPGLTRRSSTYFAIVAALLCIADAETTCKFLLWQRPIGDICVCAERNTTKRNSKTGRSA